MTPCDVFAGPIRTPFLLVVWKTSFSAPGQICPFGLSLSQAGQICPYFLISLLFFGKGSSALTFLRTWFCPFTELLCHPHFCLISQHCRSNPILTPLEYSLLRNHPRPSSCPPSDPLQTDRLTARPTSRPSDRPHRQQTYSPTYSRLTYLLTDRPHRPTPTCRLTNCDPTVFRITLKYSPKFQRKQFSVLNNKTVFCFQQNSFLFSTKQFSVFKWKQDRPTDQTYRPHRQTWLTTHWTPWHEWHATDQ